MGSLADRIGTSQSFEVVCPACRRALGAGSFCTCSHFDRMHALGDGMSDDEKGYNGWSNYPTWAVNLWLSNDEGLYNEALDLARDVYAGQIKAEGEANHPFGMGVMAESFKSWVTDDLAPDLGATFAADLLGYALGEVDWYEIAEAWVEQVKDSDTQS